MKTHKIMLNVDGQGDRLHEMVTLEDVRKMDMEMRAALNLIMGIGCVSDSESPRKAAKWVERNFPQYS